MDLKNFTSLRHLRWLNVASVGLALGAVTAMGLQLAGLPTGAPVAIPTVTIGALWAWVLRIPARPLGIPVRLGWFLSPLFAAANAGLALTLTTSLSDGVAQPFDLALRFVLMALLGATFGAVVWGPALVVTLVLFGVPIAWAQSLATRGLSGEERGEWILGLAASVLATIALVWGALPHELPEGPGGPLAAMVCGALGLLTGGVATALAWRRERQRRAFVRLVQAGSVSGFRVDAVPAGPVLVRVTALGHGYRVSDFAEEICRLDEEGRAIDRGAAAP